MSVFNQIGGGGVNSPKIEVHTIVPKSTSSTIEVETSFSSMDEVSEVYVTVRHATSGTTNVSAYRLVDYFYRSTDYSAYYVYTDGSSYAYTSHSSTNVPKIYAGSQNIMVISTVGSTKFAVNNSHVVTIIGK